MSAITGIFFRDGRTVDKDLMKEMNSKLSHRGPDGSHVWTDGPVGFGHQMLWTTPESLHEKLPFEDGESGLVITADARIDNRDELSNELDIEDKTEISDSYFILKAYEKWGESSPEYLLGDFSFVIWDENNDSLFGARDHLGVKPFYYYLSDNSFYFFSEIKSINSIPEIQLSVNEEAIYDYLNLRYENREITFYKDIFRLPAAHKFLITPEKVKFGKYWELNSTKEIKLDSNKEYTQSFKNIFDEAVRCRLRVFLSPGFMLSGGLDSSSIVCTAREILKDENLITFSAIFNEIKECDESYYINEVLEDSKIFPNYVEGDKISPLNEIDKLLQHLHEPFYSPNIFLNLSIYKLAKKKNIRIILDGFDGDTTISHGDKILTEFAYSMQLRAFIREIRGIATYFGFNPYKYFVYVIMHLLTPSFVYNIWKNFRKLMKPNWEIDNAIKYEFSKRISSIENNSVIYDELLLNAKDVREHHFLRLNGGIIQSTLELLDQLSGLFNIEIRYPFFDRRLIEFCLALPAEQKCFNGLDRIIMRRAMEGVLPSKIQWRDSKADLSNNFTHSFLKFEEDKINDFINNDSSVVQNYVDIKAIKKAFESSFMKNDVLYSIYEGIILDLWLNNVLNH